MRKELINKLITLGVELKIVDGNLKINAPKGVLNKELLEEIKSNKEYLMNLISSKVSIPKAGQKNGYELTPTQTFMWFTHEHLGGARAYNITSTLKLEGMLDISILEKAFAKVISRHESLRTVFKKHDDGIARQHIRDDFHFKLQIVEPVGFNKADIDAEIHKEYQKTFDLEHGPLLSASLITSNANTHYLVFVVHHIIGDGWSLQVLTSELLLLYNSMVNDLEPTLSSLPIQFKDYSEWLNSKLETEEYQNKLDYWKAMFNSPAHPLDLVPGSKRPSVKTYNGRVLEHQFSADFTKRIKSFTRDHQMTLFMFLSGALNGVFYRYTGQDDITLGTTVAGREHEELQGQIGLFSNAMAIRTLLQEDDSFLLLMQRQKDSLLKAYENKEYPFTELVRQLQLPKDQSRSPLFDVMVLLQNHRVLDIRNGENIKDVSAADYTEIERGVSQLDITFVFEERQDQLGLSVEYNTDIYDETFIQNLLRHFEAFVLGGLDSPETCIRHIDMLNSKEKEVLLQFNDPIVPYAPYETIIDLLDKSLASDPSRIALIDDNLEISYGQLNVYVNQLANYLQEAFGVGKGDFLAIEMERGAWAVTAILSTLKIGAVYVPVDPGYPEKRKQFIYEDCKASLIINNDLLSDFFEKKEAFGKEYDNKATHGDLAYVIYTSGSTGRPKGVKISHKAFADYVITCKNYFKLGAEDSLVQQASLSFDTSIEEIFPILTGGGTLVFSGQKEDFDGLFKICEKYHVTVLSTNPFAVQYLNEAYEKYRLNLRILISGGDVLKAGYIDNLWDKLAIYNTYGPTESTVCSTYHEVTSLKSSIPIGKPIPNRHIYILERGTDQLSPLGVPGEICISGEGLAEGYLGLDQVTQEKFSTNPFLPGKVMYRSGDLGYWSADGNVNFLGRIDDQVKVRGYRIEPGEIEQAIVAHKDVDEVVVLVKEHNGDKAIVAYIVGSVDHEELRRFLHGNLPAHMLPDFYVNTEAIPLTTNGKIDKKALLNINFKVRKQEYVQPRNILENQLASLWQEILGVDQIGINDNFFELGGHSLKVIKFINESDRQLGYSTTVKDVFENPTITLLAPRLNTGRPERIPQAPVQDGYALTSSQRRLWTLCQFEGASAAYNISNVISLKGPLDIEALKQAVKMLIDRHESLRTFFRKDAEGKVRQYIVPVGEASYDIAVHHLDISQTGPGDLLRELLAHKFDLAEAPLFRVDIVRVHGEQHLLAFNLHHIIGDGWSMEVLSREIAEVYNSITLKQPVTLPDLPVQYKDYTQWQQGKVGLDEFLKSKNYWHNQLSGELPVLELPSGKNRPKVKTYSGTELKHTFSSEFSGRLKDYIRRQDATLFMALMAGLNGLFYRYTGQTDIILGTPVAGREHADLEHQVGLYLNTIAIRTNFSSTDTYQQLLQRQKGVMLKSYEHQDYPFDTLVEELPLKRDTSRSALFDVMVVLHNQTDVLEGSNTLSGLETSKVEGIQKQHSQFDISIAFVDKPGSLEATFEYNTDIYSEVFICSLARHLENFISAGIKGQPEAIGSIEYLTSEEQKLILSDFNATHRPYPENETIVGLLEKQAGMTPYVTAIRHGKTVLTYEEVQQRSNQMAQYLMAYHHISPGDLVGIKLPRNEWMVLAVIAVLKTGAAYVAIDKDYPQERIHYIEQDSACKLSVDENVIAHFIAMEEDYTDELPAIDIRPEGLAYVIYTSGSTGQPKGVMLTHKNAATLLRWSMEEYASTDFDVMYAATSQSFDLSVFEMFFPLSVGKAIRIIANGLAIAEHLPDDKKVFINTVPSVIDSLLKTGTSLENVTAINMAGEPVPIALSNALVKYNIEIRNLYGPSEDTTYSSCYLINQLHQQSIPIGKPVANTSFYILSEGLALQGLGMPGEICISGDGLSLGYLNRQALTREKFVPNPYIPGVLMYRTGDLGKWLPNGQIAFIGRKDDQVKIRGYRIELGEIENTLLGDDRVENAVVLVREHEGDKHIVAYLKGEAIDAVSLRKKISARLPSYMLPSYFAVIDEVPLTPNGKVDKKALLQTEVRKFNNSGYVAPKTDLEHELVGIWQEILSHKKIGITDDFFDLGGHSLKATELLAIIHKQYDVQIDLQELFMRPTVENLATNIENARWLQHNDVDQSNKIII